MKNFTIRSGGMIIFIMVGMFVAGLFGVLFSVLDILKNGLSVSTIIIIFFGVYALYISVYTLINNKIIFGNSSLIVYMQDPVRNNKVSFLLSKSVMNVEYSNIQLVLIGTLREFEKKLGDYESEALRDTIQYWHRWLITNTIVMPMWVAAQFMPVIFIQVKNGESFVVSTKPYTKRVIKKFVAQLKIRNVAIITQKSLQLE